MIRTLEISGFKRFAACLLECAPLTVLTGTNGAGKTSVIHALLLAREASRSGAKMVQLNGPFGLELGNAQDVLNLHTALGTPEITVTVHLENGSSAHYVLDAHKDRLLYLPVKSGPSPAPGALGGANRSFTYLCAERLGPRDVLGASAMPTDDLGVGVRGEYCAQILALRGLEEKVALSRQHPERRNEADTFLKYQVEAWLSDIVRPVEIDAVAFPNSSVTALRFRAPGGEWVRAPNMGFGVSYGLPVVLAGLFAAENGLLLVENPEAHLHPAGQSRMGTFLATLAAAGIQILVETHSDHVVNGIRRAIGEYQTLGAESAVVHFFDLETASEPGISTLRFTKGGGLNEWPRRFFDQYQIDVAALARVRRGPAR